MAGRLLPVDSKSSAGRGGLKTIDASMEKIANTLLLVMALSVFWVPLVYVLKGPK